MAISVEEFWRLAIEGGLFVAAERQDMSDAFDRLRGAKPADSVALCKWLIEHGMLSRYQAKLLMNGRSGPFHFGDYRVYDRVESGRLAGLFRAGHLNNGQPALLSFFTGPHTQDPARRQAVESAARAAIKIQHPHVSRAEELVQTGGYKFMVLESLDGRSLAELAGGKPVSPGEVCRSMRKAAAGLARLHNLNHMHGDVRPDNILLDSSGQLKLLYFPLLCDPFAEAGAGEQNADFLAPERAAPHNKPPDPRSDIYSLGATIFTLLAGRPPFAGGDAAEKARRHASEPPPSLEQVAKTPASLSRLVAMMLSKNPQGRPAAVTDVADALLSIVERKSAGARAAESAPVNGKSRAGSPAPASGPAPGPKAAASPASPAPPPAPATFPTPTAPPVAGGPPVAEGPPVVGGPPAPAWSMPPSRMAPGLAGSGAAAHAAGSPAAPPAPPNGASQPPAGMPPGLAAYPAAAPPTNPAAPWPAAPARMVPPASAPSAITPMPAPPSPLAPSPIASPRPAIGASGKPEASAAPASAAARGRGESPAPRVAPRRAATAVAKRGKRKAPPKNQIDPKWIGGGVAAGVFVVGAIIAFVLLNKPKPVPIEQSAAMAEVKLEMAKAEADLNSKPSKARSSKPRERGDKEIAPSAPDEKPPSKGSKSRSSDDDSEGLSLVDDDGRTLWASPTTGPPLDLQYVPPGTRLIMALRPAALLQSLEGEKILAALGPGGAAARAQLEAMVGVPLGDIEQLLACFYSLDEGPPQLSLVARLAKPHSPEDLLAAWKKPEASASQANYYRGSQWAYYLPAAGANKVFSVAPLKEMEEAGDLGDDPPELGKELDKLARQTDATRTFTLLFAPSYLNGPARELMQGELASLREPLNDFFGDSVRAASLSLNWGNDFFAELRAYGSDESPGELAGHLNDGIAQLPDRVESYIAALNPGPYSRLLLVRFPQMLRVASEYTRTGDDENQAVVRCFLPLAAGHNLLMASELLASQGAGGAGAAVAKKPSGPAEALGQKISLSFTRDTLEKCMEYLSREIDTEIVITGGDLQFEGITKNQSFGLDEKDKPAREILQTVMLKANTDGKLVYVFKPKTPGGKDIIFITTRAAVAKNKYKLPPELEKAPAPMKK